jgi:hypothetical protein
MTWIGPTHHPIHTPHAHYDFLGIASTVGFSDKSATCLLLHDRIGQSYATIANSSTYLTNCYPTKVTSAQLILNIDCHVERYSINPDPISRWNQRQ